MQAEILLTLKLQQRLFADPRRIELLKQIKITGSISQGAKQAGISYKSAWDAINEMNQLADEILVKRTTGGKGGGGALLTHYGERLLQLYELLAEIQQKAFDVLKEDSLPLDSLLAAISRFSLQTSARNQFFGTIIERDHENIRQHVRVLLADGKTSICAALTEQSANRLNLVHGKEVLVLIKAPWIMLTKEHIPATSFDNILPSQISHIETGTEYSEILLTLAHGESLCVTLSNQEVRKLKLQPNDWVSALFNADKVIIATLC
ncbi:transcriptional repressor for molybdate uptake [Xenorhabdus nematophila ATCC 19061]|uniref:Transcriptional repressor for molybdate uptake n=1 Tax=Xenorhabdus nematophila (strain ATCC 19061 / DSM 3370 / CCUG 14189 / LMG 1036 / NCIMB 9965 / AN6) TaxID=406817 RepID=D3VAQ6_XENNA|nr:molybdenum-dependent transcriptional regulator [Xenorhabdus nematophila]CBJ89492.1 transcriptional repressor for molybdate uptake [Xenorhabdus nematophila ATCC 19061]CEK22385.1 transcriptional repressor for molybdate uptake [Xenorhabdus nematophila AN6/1]